jgi:hypothetical protein
MRVLTQVKESETSFGKTALEYYFGIISFGKIIISLGKVINQITFCLHCKKKEIEIKYKI